MTSNLSQHYVSNRTARTYYEMIANGSYLMVDGNPTHKTIVHAQAESSLYSTMSLIASVVYINLIEVKAPQGHQSIKKRGTEGSQRLYDIVSNVLGTKDIYPISPSLLTCTNDTVLFVHKEKFNKKKNTGKKSLISTHVDKKVHNIYTTAPLSSNKAGMRVHLTTAISAGDQVATIYVTVRGSSSKELSIQE
eukprot:3140778-Ditylum_brightwellii.AAC.1